MPEPPLRPSSYQPLRLTLGADDRPTLEERGVRSEEKVKKCEERRREEITRVMREDSSEENGINRYKRINREQSNE
jgi:hypothetical protein